MVNKVNIGVIKMEKLVLELFKRIQNLEEKCEKLENRVVELEESNDIEINDDELQVKSDDKKVTRSTSRRYVMKQLIDNNKNLYAQKGSRSMGTDILIDKDPTFKIKYSHSKSYEDFPCGWYRVNKSELSKYDMYIFCIANEGEYEVVLVSQEDMSKLIKLKEHDTNEDYHFYICVLEDKRVVDTREKEEIDMSNNYEDWTLVDRLIKSK